ncbi:MAG: hypothetical protein ACR2H6_09510 [Pyrinomonadaceae bacterium]
MLLAGRISIPSFGGFTVIKLDWKRIISWLLVVTGMMGVGLSYWVIRVLVAYFAAGLVWFAQVALLVSDPEGSLNIRQATTGMSWPS